MFIKGNEGNMTQEQEDIIDRVLDSEVLNDMARDFADRHLGNETDDIFSDIPISTWHSLWDETDTQEVNGTLEITQTVKVSPHLLCKKVVSIKRHEKMFQRGLIVELASQYKSGAMIPQISFPGGYGAYYEQVHEC